MPLMCALTVLAAPVICPPPILFANASDESYYSISNTCVVHADGYWLSEESFRGMVAQLAEKNSLLNTCVGDLEHSYEAFDKLNAKANAVFLTFEGAILELENQKLDLVNQESGDWWKLPSISLGSALLGFIGGYVL